jgi:hypothetical protein
MQKVAPDSHARLAEKAVSFKDLPPIGTPQQEVADSQTVLRGIEQVDFANGVKVQLWPTQDDPGRVTVKVRFGAAPAPLMPRTMSMPRWAAWRWSARARAIWGRKSWTVSPLAARWASS